MVVLYSSHTEVIQSWQDALTSEEISICNHEKALLRLLSSLQAEVILLLEERHYGDETEGFLALLQTEYSFIKTIVLSQNPNFAKGSLFLKWGIKAYGNTYMAPLYLNEALQVVRKDDIWLYPDFIQMMIQTLSTHKASLPLRHDLLEKLSHKEREVALLIKEGLSNKEIAVRVNITERTVKAHLSSVYEKLGIKDRLALALLLF